MCKTPAMQSCETLLCCRVYFQLHDVLSNVECELQIAAMEVEFARQAWRDPALRSAYSKHAMVGAVGIACFSLENRAVAMNIDCVHSLWHCLACYAVASTNALMAKREAQELQRILA